MHCITGPLIDGGLGGHAFIAPCNILRAEATSREFSRQRVARREQSVRQTGAARACVRHRSGSRQEIRLGLGSVHQDGVHAIRCKSMGRAQGIDGVDQIVGRTRQLWYYVLSRVGGWGDLELWYMKEK